MLGCFGVTSKNVDTNKTTVLPTDSTQMTSFLCACSVHRRFIENFSKVTVPINDYLRKDKVLDW